MDVRVGPECPILRQAVQVIGDATSSLDVEGEGRILGHAGSGIVELVAPESITERPLGELATKAGGDGTEDTPFSDLSMLAVRGPVQD